MFNVLTYKDRFAEDILNGGRINMSRIRLWLATIITIGLLVTVIGLTVPRVSSNPIPAPTIFLHYEHMVFNFTKISDDAVHVAFYGRYIMENVYYGSTVHMYFPVPNETDWDTVHVYVDGEEVSTGKTWVMVLPDGNHTYNTAVGALPLIEWYVYNKTGKFTVEVYYNYTFSLLDGAGYTIYALGTGKYYYTYSKQCIAHVIANYNGFENTLVRAAYLNPYTGQKEYTKVIRIDKNHVADEFYLLSPTFSSFTDDLVFEFTPLKPEYSRPEINEINGELDIINTYQHREYATITIRAHVEPGKPIILGLTGYADEKYITINISVGSTKTSEVGNLTIRSSILVPGWKNEPSPRTLLVIVNNEIVLNETVSFTAGGMGHFEFHMEWVHEIENETTNNETNNETEANNGAEEQPNTPPVNTTTTTPPSETTTTPTSRDENRTTTSTTTPADNRNLLVPITIAILVLLIASILFIIRR